MSDPTDVVLGELLEEKTGRVMHHQL